MEFNKSRGWGRPNWPWWRLSERVSRVTSSHSRTGSQLTFILSLHWGKAIVCSLVRLQSSCSPRIRPVNQPTLDSVPTLSRKSPDNCQSAAGKYEYTRCSDEHRRDYDYDDEPRDIAKMWLCTTCRLDSLTFSFLSTCNFIIIFFLFCCETFVER